MTLQNHDHITGGPDDADLAPDAESMQIGDRCETVPTVEDATFMLNVPEDSGETDIVQKPDDDMSDGDDSAVPPEDAHTPETGESETEALPEHSAPPDPDGDEDDTDDEDDAGDEEDPKDDDSVGEEDDAEEDDAEGDDAEREEADGDDNADAPDLPITSIVEAVLFAARGPLKLAQIARAVGRRTRQDAVRKAIEELNVQYLETSRAFEIAELSGSFQLMSRPEFVNHILRIYPKKDLAEKEKNQRLTPAALDTLAIIAYKQPVTRADIEHIRGVGCGPVLRALIERGTVKVVGKRADLVGQPLVYGTTDAFLAEFGLGSLDELPHRAEFLGLMGSNYDL